MTRLAQDLEVAEDAVQEACAAAVVAWGRNGVPANPRAWLVGAARHKALDWLRREAIRADKEKAALLFDPRPDRSPAEPVTDDQLALICLCCHPALDAEAQVGLTLRSVCGLRTDEIAAAFLIPESTLAQRVVRAKRKIREAGIPFGVPAAAVLPQRLSAVLRVLYLVFTEGHRASTTGTLVRPELCEEAIHLARGLHGLLPAEPEVQGLLAMLLLVDARRPGRLGPEGRLVLLEDQDRRRWDGQKIAEGAALVEAALAAGRPGPYQIQAAIAACHSTAASAAATDWTEITALYEELLRWEPTPVVKANHAVALAMADGPAVGLRLLAELSEDSRLQRWAPFHIAQAGLLERIGRQPEAVAAYRTALALEQPGAEHDFVAERIQHLGGGR